MKGERHFAGIGREAGVDGQNIQHFMSESPWSGEAVCRQVQDELKARPELLWGGVLRVDEGADEKAGDKVAGVSKQYNGRMGKVETSQVGGVAKLREPQGDARLLDLARRETVPGWFEESHKTLRERLGIPKSRSVSKPKWSWPGN
jgi:SRSO17 transposase